ncbi:MAG: leucyl aminopeptidase family protein [Bacteroidales bacterium]|nr:leucyl aminopeptidase family protein [Bacteroidales bacterium]
MIYSLKDINPKTYEGNLVFLYGDESAERVLPLGKREVELVRGKRAEARGKNFIVSFDRLPWRLYFVSFDSERPAAEVQETLRCQAAELLKMMEKDGVKQAGLCAEGTLPEEVAAMVEGLTLADYSFDRFRSKECYHLEELTISSMFFSPEELETQERLWGRIFWCREWVNLPVADLNAEAFADELQAVAKDLEGVTCTVMDKRMIESLRMGGLLAVNKGSVDEPRFVVLEYCPSNQNNPSTQSDPIVLVGKGIMYDTGGLNIKPDDYMQEMKSDMAGAATMASVVFAAADNRLPVHVVALLPLTDNRPGFNAYAADDILTMYDGTTVEVVNTDAEGRLILADAIAYAVKNYHPRVIIDAATLTGAAVRAISTFGIAAMQTHAEREMEMLKIVGNEVYERLVEFPMWKEYDELIKSDFADLRNCGSTPQAGTITASKFLAHFAKEVPYVHLDIAGVAYFTKPQQYYRVGASGYGIRLLYAYLQMQEK